MEETPRIPDAWPPTPDEVQPAAGEERSEAEAGPEPSALRAEPRWADRVAWAILAVALALLVHGAWRVGPTYDEHYYVAAGYAYWQDGEYALNREHPPLLKRMAGFPLLFLSDVDFPEQWQDLVNYPVTFFYQRNGADLDRNLFLARLPFCLLTVFGAWLVYRAGRRYFGARAGLVGLVLFAFNPNVLAHGRLAGLDMGVAVLMFASALAFLRLLEERTHGRRLAAALWFGLANMAKFTALVLGPFFVLLAGVAAFRKRSAAPVADLALVFLGGLTVFAAGYGFEAKSVNAAWSRPQYVDVVHDPEVYDVQPRHLAEAARGAGLGGEALERVKNALALGPCIDRLGELALEGGSQGDAALVALAEVRLAAADDKKRAFARAIEAGPGVDRELQLSVLSRLADLELSDLDAWRRWFARNRHEDWNRTLFTKGWIRWLTRGLFGDERPIPLFTAWKGIDYQLHHAKFGHGSYFRGKTLAPLRDFKEGNPYPEFYSVVMALKNPLAFLVLALAGIGLAFRGGARGWGLAARLTFVALPVGLFVYFSGGNALMGVRYVLPVFPFLAVLAGRGAALMPRAAFVLAALAVLESAWIHPHELMYYNLAAGGPVGGPRTTVVGDDWGQDVRALGRWYREHRDEVEEAGGLYYDPYSAGDMAAFGLDAARPVVPGARGIVAVNAVIYYREQASYEWLREYEPFQRLGWSVWLYDTRGGPPGADPREAWSR